MHSEQQTPEKRVRRLAKVAVRTLHLVGAAGLFGGAMMGQFATSYVALVLVSGVVLTLLDIGRNLLWFVQWRGVALYLKLVCLAAMHTLHWPAVPCLVVVIVISGLISHAPSWIRYYSLRHGRVVTSSEELLG